ncbi:MAG: hypothetical protein ABIH70_01485 [Chloroflexota bacterium]
MNKAWTIIFVVGLLIVTVGVGVAVARATGDMKDAYVPALTAALVWVTAFYAVSTASILEATNQGVAIAEQQAEIMLNSQFNAAAPVTTLEANQENPGFIRIIYMNAGKGPALNFRCWIENPEHSELKARGKAILQMVIPVALTDDKRYSDIALTDSYKVGMSQSYIRAQYESIFGKTYESRLMFPANVSPQLEWGEAKEIIRL